MKTSSRCHLSPGLGRRRCRLSAKCSPNLRAPAPDTLIRDNSAALRQEQFDISKAQAEHVVEPDRVADDLGGKAMAIMRVGWWFHPAQSCLDPSRLPVAVTVTTPPEVVPERLHRVNHRGRQD